MPQRGALRLSLTTLTTVAALSGGALAQPGATPATSPGAPGAVTEDAPPGDGTGMGYENVGGPAAAGPQPQGAPPPGSTQASFVSTGIEPWDVLLDRTPVCGTPCSLYVEPGRFVSLREQRPNPVRLDIGQLPPNAAVVVAGTHMREGRYAGGIVGVTFAGMGLVAGITLTAVGYGTDRPNMGLAGLITGGASALGLYGSIYLMKTALPRYTIAGAQPYATGQTVGLAGSF